MHFKSGDALIFMIVEEVGRLAVELLAFMVCTLLLIAAVAPRAAPSL